ncbi:uncharacterized protein LODBEIA_P45700 [Lodderomyces beijingensis]|uniref:Late endosomal/lysosomal adaptor and MAPK and MTOR activator 1 n=1 Tax=Lodderomyces beijingensis TaxID=1775926 RepID=A0ABP0ZQA9_9ASCO
MGVCFSCLNGGAYDQEDDETTSLLRRNQLQQDSNVLQEEEMLKQQQRQQELSSIVNDLSDKLIDVTSFLNNSSSQILTPPAAAASREHSTLQGSTSNLNAGVVRGTEKLERSYPYAYSKSEREKVVDGVKKLDDATRQACQVSVSEPLYLKF